MRGVPAATPACATLIVSGAASPSIVSVSVAVRASPSVLGAAFSTMSLYGSQVPSTVTERLSAASVAPFAAVPQFTFSIVSHSLSDAADQARLMWIEHARSSPSAGISPKLCGVIRASSGIVTGCGSGASAPVSAFSTRMLSR